MIVPIAVLGGGLIVVGAGLMILGAARTITRREVTAFRRSVATGIVGSGIAALGVSALIVSFGRSEQVSLIAALMVAVVGVGQIVVATLIGQNRRG